LGERTPKSETEVNKLKGDCTMKKLFTILTIVVSLLVIPVSAISGVMEDFGKGKKVAAHHSKADNYLAEGDYDNAIVEYTKAIKVDKKSVESYKLRALAYEKKGKDSFDKVYYDLKKACELGECFEFDLFKKYKL
jgi:Tfp pilus assembly protein PilF